MNQILFFIFRFANKISFIWRKWKIKYYYSNIIRKTAKQYIEPLKVNGPSRINNNTYLGKNVNFNGFYISGDGRVDIGSNFHSGVNCKIIAQNHNYKSEIAIPYDSSYIRKGVIIGDNVWLGDNVIILDGISIGEGAIVQAGSVVVSDIPQLAIAGGHPARVFSNRNKELYFKLKEEGKFH